tara:strand:+ start:774 stop:1391 length:618 start_codon:yes stop_codon:yes gene_type:complete
LSRSETTKKVTRIQRKKTTEVLDAALDVFSINGFRGSTIDMIAKRAGLSKANIFYYFNSKEEIHSQLISQLLEKWLEPLKKLSATGDPTEEICDYVSRKLQMSKIYPRESRLFANEILQGAPRIHKALKSDLKDLVDEKILIIQKWSDDGLIAEVHPYHLIFSIWSLTQHYSDFDVQVRAVLTHEEPYENAELYLHDLFTKLLKP